MAEVKLHMEAGNQDVVDAMLQGTTRVAVGHALDHEAFAEVASQFEKASRGVAFFEVEDTVDNQHHRAELFKAACVTLAALSSEMGQAQRAAQASRESEDDDDDGEWLEEPGAPA